MRTKLTDQAINKAARDAEADGKRRELADLGCQGLRIRITPTGRRSWILGARDKIGKARRFSLGSYPAMGISVARDAARAMRHRVKHEGADPIAEKRRNVVIGKQSRAGVGTLKALLDTYEAHGNPPKSWYPGRPRVELVFRKALTQPCSILTLGELQLEADSYPFPKSAAFAVRTLRPILKWAAQPGRVYVSRDLTQLVTPAKIKARKRFLDEDEIRAVLPLLRGSERPHDRMMHFLLLTLARREEAAVARWRHIDLDGGTWIIPKPKNTEPHIVPLSRQARELLKAIGPGSPDALVFLH
jgi:integrase